MMPKFLLLIFLEQIVAVYFSLFPQTKISPQNQTTLSKDVNIPETNHLENKIH